MIKRLKSGTQNININKLSKEELKDLVKKIANKLDLDVKEK